MKVEILQKAMKPFVHWLDSCDQLVKELPVELEKADLNHLGELSFKYKVSVMVTIAVVPLNRDPSIGRPPLLRDHIFHARFCTSCINLPLLKDHLSCKTYFCRI